MPAFSRHLLLAFWLAAPLYAVDDWPVPRGPAHEPAPYRYNHKVWASVPRAYLEDAPACTLYAATTHLIDADGTVETITHEITRFNGRKGIDSRGEYRNILFDPSYEKLTLNEARVLKADGRVVAVEPKHVHLRDVATDYLVYNHEKQLVISFPALEVGDAIDVKWTTRGRNPEYQGHFFSRYQFGDDEYPIVLDELRLRLPKERTLKHAAIGGQVAPRVTEDDTTRTFLWSVSNRDALPRDENLPSKEDLRLQVAFSTFPSWEAIGAWKKKLRGDCWTCTDELRRVVAEVIEPLKTPEEKARALTYWVRRHIRYVSSGEKHDFTPHAPNVVLANRYGDCKDTTQLLAVMLREAGLPVALATIGALDDGQVLESVPSPWGTHAILLVTLGDKQHWIDTTASLAGWDMLPRDDRNRQTYVVDDNGLRLMRTPQLTPDDNRVMQTTRVNVGADGSTRVERDVTYYGLAAYSQRNDWTDVPPGERRRLVTADLQDANMRARLRHLMIDESRLRDFDKPVSARIVYEVPRHFRGETEKEGSFTDSAVWSRLLTFTIDDDRKTPLEFGAPCELIHRFHVQLSPAWRVPSPPRDRIIRSKWGSFRVRITEPQRDPHHLDFELRLRLESTRVEPADFDAFRKFHEEVQKEYRVWLTLQPTASLTDAAAMEALLALTPGDKALAEALGKLYLQNAMKDDAHRVVASARYYHPGNRTLGELAVQAASDVREQEKALRQLVHHFPTEPKYALALGEVLVDADRPADAARVLESWAKDGDASTRSQALFQLARGAFRLAHADEALKYLRDADKVDPESAHDVVRSRFKGRVCEQLGKLKQAVDAYRQALAADADDTESLGSIVRLQTKLGNAPEALEALRRYTVAVGDDVAGLAKAADYHLKLKRYEEAFDLAARARDDDFLPLAQRTLGLIYAHRDNWRRALDHLERAETDAEVLEAIIRGQIAIGKLGKAEKSAARAAQVAQPTNSLKAACEVTSALVKRRTKLRETLGGNHAEQTVEVVDAFVCAEQLFLDGRPAGKIEPLLETATEFGPSLALRGQLALERGRLTNALADAERAVTLAPSEARGWLVRGRVRLERGHAGALGDLQKAVELSAQRDATALYWLATSQLRAGQSAQALASARLAAQLRPKDAEIGELLEKLERDGKSTSPNR
jgi:tetratricopeptide (TPR) repeat protein/transglutaminase-like putative cysteine protease